MIRSRLLILRNALAAMSVRLVFVQIALAALVFLLSVVWLRLPDSSVLSVLATILLGALVLALASGGEMALMLWLCNRPRTRGRMLKGAILLLVGVAIWFVWSALIDIFQARDTMLAGYLNSRFPASLRNIFSYDHIYRGLEWIASVLQWIGAGILAIVVYSMAASAQPLRAIRRILFSATYWIALLAGSFVASTLTRLLISWTPGHALSVELLSLILRLGILAIVDAVIVLFVLAVISACIQRSDSFYETPAGGPDSNQPLTAEAP